MTFRLATPADLARMSWHQRERYHARRRAYAKSLEAERPPARDSAAVQKAFHAVVAAICEAAYVTPKKPPTEFPTCGTLGGYRRHLRVDEWSCQPCLDAANEVRKANRARREAAA